MLEFSQSLVQILDDSVLSCAVVLFLGYIQPQGSLLDDPTEEFRTFAFQNLNLKQMRAVAIFSETFMVEDLFQAGRPLFTVRWSSLSADEVDLSV
jgi:hypothetical protein